MLITLVIIVIDWLVLTINEVPYLTYHCFYLAFLTILLNRRKQPSNYSFPVQSIPQLQQTHPSTLPQTTPTCSICQNAKPPRYYHCRHCSRCIYRLDHHCDFVGNCIGQHNYKVYVHLLFNGFVHCVAVVGVMGWSWREMV